MKFAFTKTAIEELSPKASKRVWHGDLKVRGLMVVVYSNGKKSFYLNRRVGGRMEKLVLGRFPDLSVDAARSKAEAVEFEHRPKARTRPRPNALIGSAKRSVKPSSCTTSDTPR